MAPLKISKPYQEDDNVVVQVLYFVCLKIRLRYGRNLGNFQNGIVEPSAKALCKNWKVINSDPQGAQPGLGMQRRYEAMGDLLVGIRTNELIN